MQLNDNINKYYEDKCSKGYIREHSVLFQNMMTSSTYEEIRFVFTNKFLIYVTVIVKEELTKQGCTMKFSFDLEDTNFNRLELSGLVLSKIDKIYYERNLMISCDIFAEYELYGYMGDINKKCPWTEQREVLKNHYLLDYNEYNETYTKLMEYINEM